MDKRIHILTILLVAISISLNAQIAENTWPVLKTYTGDQLNKIAMPLGGIGTGTVSIGGRGDLKDWEIVNQGALGWKPVFNSARGAIDLAPFFTVRTKDYKGEIQSRLLEGPLSDENLGGDWGSNDLNAGFPRFSENKFEAAYPLAQLQLNDEKSPVRVVVQAFNPMIPGDVKNSSIPAAIFKYTIYNKTDKDLETSVCGVVPNFIGTDGWGGSSVGNKNTFRRDGDISGIFMENVKKDSLNGKWGTMALTTTATEGVSHRTQWSNRILWNESIVDFWDDLNDDGALSERTGKYPGNKPASLAVSSIIPANGSKEFVFILSWNFPYRLGWEGQPRQKYEIIKNHYSTIYEDAWSTAKEVWGNIESLENRTVEFVEAFVNSDVPEVIKEAALFNSANLRSQTVFRDQDGYTFGWEGTGSIFGSRQSARDLRAGWGFGSCTHVWNYEVTTPFLFGEIAMSMRDVEFKYSTNLTTGKMAHRVNLPLKTSKQNHSSAADGQLGCIMKVYRDWQLSGDDEKLEELYPYIKAAMQYAWNKSGWDKDANGVIEGIHFNTMDVHYIGPNPQIATWYLGALRASEEMALYMKDKDFALKCKTAFENGSKWTDENLFNGDYYIQIVPKPKNYQVGKGILVDQLVGQYMAHICGLGYLLDKNNITTTLKTIRKYNFIEDFNNHLNTNRSYAVGNEKGLRMAHYFPNTRESVPFPYYSEVMTGFEHSTGAHMLYEGLENEGMEVISAIRDRFDGRKRNPFNEGEWGHRYGRAMASYSSLLAYTGFNYSAVTGIMKFNAIEGNYFWSNGYAYGTITIKKKGSDYDAKIKVLHGELKIEKLVLKGANTIKYKRNTILTVEKK